MLKRVPTSLNTKSHRENGDSLCLKKWAILDLNNPANTPEKPHNPSQGAAKSAAESGNHPFAEAVRAVMALPGLTDAERAEAVRRLLKG